MVVRSPVDDEELARFPLRGRYTRLRGQRMPGRGWVVARRVPERHDHPEGTDYDITYPRAAIRQGSTCPTGGTVLIGGMWFEHVPAAAGGAATPPVAVPGSHANQP